MNLPHCSKVTTIEPPVKTRPEVETEVITSIEASTLEDSHVYVHCHLYGTFNTALIRIWKTTFLVDAASATKSSLVHAENISYAPQWTHIPVGTSYTFLLIFEALPKSCLKFDLIEEIESPNGFHVPNIQRNETDVYHVNIAS